CGIIDQIIEGDLLTGAIAFAREQSEPRRTRDLPVSLATIAIEAARGVVCKTARGALAPMAAIDSIEAGATLGFDAGSQREMQIFADCVVSQQSRHMVRLFFAEREAAKVPGIGKDTPVKEVRRAAVVGAGTMGGGIAMTYANAGIPVLLKETDQAAPHRGPAPLLPPHPSTPPHTPH